MTIGGSLFMQQVIEFSTMNDMKIDIEIGAGCKKNYLKFYKKIKSIDGSARTKSKKVEISKAGLASYDIGQLAKEVMLFLTLD
jgi:hypothetical protein